MASDWFCKISGKLVGPLTSQQLKTYADQGRLRREDHVRQGNDGPWVAAAKVKGLFGDGHAPAGKTSDPGKSKSAKSGVQPPMPPAVQPPAPPPQAAVGGVMPVVMQPVAGVPVAYTVGGVPMTPVAGAVPPVGLPVGYAVQSVPPMVVAPTVLAPRPSGVGADDKTIPGLVVGNGRGKTPDKGDGEVHRRRKSKTPVYVVSICGTILIVGGGLGLLHVLNQRPTAGKATATAKTDAKNGQTEAEKKPATVDLDDLDVNRAKRPAEAGESGSGAATPATADKEKPVEPPAKSEWHDVTKGALPYKAGEIDVTLKIDPVQVGRPPFDVVDPKTMKPIDKVVTFTVTLDNVSQAKPVELKPFSSQLQAKALVDDQNATYRPVRFGAAQTIAPGKIGADKVAFEAPADAARALRLTLPAEAFGGQGPLKFEIPVSVITQAPAVVEKPAGAAAAPPEAKKNGLLRGEALRKDASIPPIDLNDMFDTKPKAVPPAKEAKTEKAPANEKADPADPFRTADERKSTPPAKETKTEKAPASEKSNMSDDPFRSPDDPKPEAGAKKAVKRKK